MKSIGNVNGRKSGLGVRIRRHSAAGLPLQDGSYIVITVSRMGGRALKLIAPSRRRSDPEGISRRTMAVFLPCSANHAGMNPGA